MSRYSRLAVLALTIGGVACSSGSTPPDNKPINNGTPRVSELSASQDVVAKGAKVTLAWTIAGVDSATIDITASTGASILSGGTNLQGTIETPAIEETTTFELTANANGKSAKASVTVTVSAAAVSIIAFSASPSPGQLGGTTTLSWTTAGATRVRVLRGAAELLNTTTMTTQGTLQATLDAELNSFTLDASNGTASDRRELTVAAMGMMGMILAESEPNDTAAAADPITSGATGEINPGTDVDVYSFSVPEGGSVYAQTSDGNGGCNFDSVLTLLAPDGTTEVGSVDEGGPVNCSEIDPAYYSFATGLAAGTYYLAVASYAQTSTGTYTLAVVTSAPGCGNRVLEPGEQCDDGNTADGDRCSASCQIEVAGSITGANGQVTVNLGASPDSAMVAVQVTQAGQSIEASTGACSMDTVLSLLKDGQYLGWVSEDPMMSPCAAIPFPTAFAIDLEAGTYLLEVGNEGDMPGMATVSVTIHNPACGNGTKEARAGEQCDDGNMNDADGCSNTCQAQSLGSVSGPPGEQSFTGSLAPGEEALYQVTMTSMGYIWAETFIGMTGACDGEGSDTELAILDSTHQEIGTNSDSGPGLCALIDPNVDTFALVAPGTYFVRVKQWDATVATPAYGVLIRALAIGCGNRVLESGEACDDGNTAGGDGCTAACQLDGSIVNEAEPNNASAQATDTGAMPNQTATVHGAIDPVIDSDWYVFEVPAGAAATLSARIYSVVGQPTGCNNGQTDTKLFLHAADGTELTYNDDNGSQYCSFIDGTTDMAAASLAQGRYYLRVEHYSNSTVIGSYFLDVRLTR